MTRTAIVPEEAIALVARSRIAGLDLRRFDCLPSCGRCCGYKVSLLDADIARLESAGHARSEFLDTERAPANGFFGCLGIRNGACVFLDEDKRCREYENRPVCCRLYPYIREAYLELQLDVDLSCPGVGQGGRVSNDDLAAVLAADGTDAAHARLLDAHAKALRAAERMTASRARFEPFGEVVEKLDAAGAVGLDTLMDFLAASAPVVPARLLPGERPAADRRAAPGGDAAETLRDYLLFWSRRQALRRWADAIIVVTPTIRSRLEAMSRFLCDLAETLLCRVASARESAPSGCEEMLSAIRECDGYYRTYSQGFRLSG